MPELQTYTVQGNLYARTLRRKDLCDIYGLTYRQLKKKLDEIEEVRSWGSHYFTPKQMGLIVLKLGFPEGYKKEEASNSLKQN